VSDDLNNKAHIWAKTMSEWEVEHNVLNRVLKAAKALSIPPYPTREKGTPVIYTEEFKLLYHKINTSSDIQKYRTRALPRWYNIYLNEACDKFSSKKQGVQE